MAWAPTTLCALDLLGPKGRENNQSTGKACMSFVEGGIPYN